MSQISTTTSFEETASSTPELVPPNSEHSIEESEEVTIPSLPPPLNSQRSYSSPSVTYESLNEDYSNPQSSIGNLSDDDSSNPTTVIITSPSFNSNLSSEQNDSIDSLNSTSPPSSFLQTNQRRIEHRRNKSEPFKSLSTDDLLSSTNNDSSISNNAREENRRKSSIKIKATIDDKTPPTSITTLRKKKAWYNPFQSTYRQRNEEFRKIFKDLPNEERLVVDYSCAWQKDILAQGRMYSSSNYLCFYANILNWKSSLCLKFDDIKSITREKTAKVISNAIEVKTKKGEKYFFASFVTRDKAHALLNRLLQAVENHQSISSQQLWYIIHENYGDDLDMTTDEDDDHHKSFISSKSTQQYDLSYIVLRIPPQLSQATPSQVEDEHSSLSSHQTDDDEESMQKEPINGNTESYLTECPCETHLATQLINRTYSMSVEHLFDRIFGQNDFLNAYRASRRIKDYHADEWQVNSETEKRERLCTYKVTVAAVFGSTTICSNERQIIDCELSHSHYIIHTEVRNEGIKYADTFYVSTRYCLVQIDSNKTHLKVTSEVKYVKSLMAIIKTFIEKNAMAALQDSYADLSKRLEQESSKQARIINPDGGEKGIRIHTGNNRRASRQCQSDELNSSANDLSINSQEQSSMEDQIKTDLTLSDRLFSSKNTFLIVFCIITTLLLLIVNIFLCIKLNQIDQMTDRLVHNSPSWLHRYSYQENDNEWAILLKSQEEYYQTQLTSLQTVLTTTHNALKNVTDALNQLTQWSSRSS